MTSSTAASDQDVSANNVGCLFAVDEPLVEQQFHFGGQDQCLKILPSSQQSFNVQGHVLWPSAPKLSGFLCDTVEGRSLLQSVIPSNRMIKAAELGSGCGLAGIVLAQQLSHLTKESFVLLSDYDREVVDLLTSNASSISNAQVKKLDWRIPLVDQSIESASFDLLIASDVTYATELLPPLFTCAYNMLRSGSPFLLVNGRWRYFEDQSHQAAIKAGFTLLWERSEDAFVLSQWQKP